MSAPDPVPPDARTPPTPAPPPPAPARRIVDGGFLVLLGFTALGMAGVWLLKGPGRLGAILLQEAGFILALSPKLLGGVFIAATLPLLMPRDRVAGWLGRDSGWRGRVPRRPLTHHSPHRPCRDVLPFQPDGTLP